MKWVLFVSITLLKMPALADEKIMPYEMARRNNRSCFIFFQYKLYFVR